MCTHPGNDPYDIYFYYNMFYEQHCYWIGYGTLDFYKQIMFNR